MKTIPTDVLNVLDAAHIDGNKVVLTGQLDRSLYTATNKILEAAGGKWSRKDKAHVFDGDAAEALEQVILTGSVNKKQELGQFDSPPPVVARVLELAGIKEGHEVLEPSAGHGNIAKAAREAGGNVFCVETDGTRAARLADAGLPVMEADFLKVEPQRDIDRVVMNPPFAKQADIDHVRHAARFLKPGGRLVSVMATGVLFRANKKAVAFREWIDAMGGSFIELPEDAFKEAGTGVRTCIVTFDLPETMAMAAE